MLPIRGLLCASTLFVVAALAGCVGLHLSPSDDQRQSLAPTGRLRVGVHSTSTAKGVITSLGKSLAERLGVEFVLVEVKSQAELLAGIAAGEIDFSGTNASLARSARMDFTSTVLDLELGYLVVAGSSVSTISDVDRAGVRIGVSPGSTSLTTLPKLLKNATVIPMPPSKTANQMLHAKEIDAYATNKSILLRMSGDIPNSRILDGKWGVEHWALCIPKGRDTGLVYLKTFIHSARAKEVVKAAAGNAGLSGSVVP